MPERGRVVELLVFIAALTGCSPGTVDLNVDVRTDFAPGTELTATHTVLDGVARDHAVAVGEPWLGGVRVADFVGVASGAHTLDVTLLGGTRALATRRVAVTVTRSLAVTVVLARSCAGVTCPGAHDDPSATTCVNGSCASPACDTPGGPACPVCHVDGDCAVSTVACAPTRCTSGVCLRAPDTALCGPAQLCDVAVGCVSVAAMTDGGLCHTCCGDDGDCPHALPRCNVGSQVCEQCRVDTEGTDCPGTTCLANGACTTTPVDSVADGEPCATDHECMSPSSECVPDPMGPAPGYCTPRLGPSCAGAPPAFHVSTTATSLGGIAGDYCVPVAGTAAYSAAYGGCGSTVHCAGGRCTGPPIPFCTYDCTSSADCPPPGSCGSGGYCIPHS